MTIYQNDNNLAFTYNHDDVFLTTTKSFYLISRIPEYIKQTYDVMQYDEKKEHFISIMRCVNIEELRDYLYCNLTYYDTPYIIKMLGGD